MEFYVSTSSSSPKTKNSNNFQLIEFTSILSNNKLSKRIEGKKWKEDPTTTYPFSSTKTITLKYQPQEPRNFKSSPSKLPSSIEKEEQKLTESESFTHSGRSTQYKSKLIQHGKTFLHPLTSLTSNLSFPSNTWIQDHFNSNKVQVSQDSRNLI